MSIRGVSTLTMKGENASQSPAELFDSQTGDHLSLACFMVIAGNDPSYNNLTDLEAALQTMTHIGAAFKANGYMVPWIALGLKHGSACGVGVSLFPEVAMQSMVEGDPQALFGGLVMTNFEIDESLAEIVSHHASNGRRILDGVAASGITQGAREILSRKKGECRLMVNSFLEGDGAAVLDTAQRFRYVRGGFMTQKNYTFVLDLNADYMSYNGPVVDHQQTLQDCLIAWAVGSTSVSNTITIVRDGMLLSNAVGQQSRVKAARLALDTPHDVTGALAYSDSFFPFTDGLEILVKAGIKTVFATSGSIRDKDVIAFAEKSGVTMIMAPDKEARGFYRH
ncbi:MAG: hypothetical protein Q8R30_03725 [bacterium]|nr:hypothetical protein [bacterium]